MTAADLLAMAAESYDRHAEHCPGCPPRVWDRPPPSCGRGIRLHAMWASRQREVWLALSDQGWHR
jgi:hypothetical protein